MTVVDNDATTSNDCKEFWLYEPCEIYLSFDRVFSESH